MVIPALGDLATELDTDATGVAWTLTAYLLAAAVATPVAGRLGDMFGKRRMLVASLALFATGAAVSAVGSTLHVVVLGRLLQGLGGGIFPLCFGIIRDEFPRERVAGGIGFISAILGIGGGLGLVLGRLLVDAVGFQIIFWFGRAMAGIAAVAAQFLVPEAPVRSPGRADGRGALVLGAGLAAPLLAISQANAWGWGDPRTLGLIVAGLVVLALWVPLERRTAQPLADIPTLAAPPVLMTNLATFFVGFGMFGAFLLIPQLVEAPESTGYGFGLDATGAGLLLLPGALTMLVAGPLSGRLSTTLGSRVPLAIGGVLTALGLTGLAIAHDTYAEIIAGNVLMSVGFGFAFAAMPNLIVDAVPIERTGEATGFNALVRSVGSSVGSQVSAAILAASVLTVGPRDTAFTEAFILCAALSLLAAVLAALIPRPGERVGVRVAARQAA